jgi:Acetyltransferases
MLKDYTFKKLPLSNLEKAIVLIWEVFLEFEAPDYDKNGVEEFKKFITYNSLSEKMKNHELSFFSCYDDGKIVGIIGYNRSGHIHLLFVDKHYHKQGIAKTLFHELLNQVNELNSQKEITVNSSPYAHEIYQRMGFVDTDKEQMINGIRFYPMKYTMQ